MEQNKEIKHMGTKKTNVCIRRAQSMSHFPVVEKEACFSRSLTEPKLKLNVKVYSKNINDRII